MTRKTKKFANKIRALQSPRQLLRPTVNIEAREIIDKGWFRALNKYSPSKETLQSPIKATVGNLKGVLINDAYVETKNWTVNMSEQHFYDNSFLLISYAKSDEKMVALILHRSFLGIDMAFFSDLGETTLLGKGSFGSVYSCRDPKTNLKYAIKHIFGQYKNFSDHTNNLLSYMSERNANIRATDSPFITKFFYSFQLQSTGDSFLFFEFCIGDLSTFINLTSYQNPSKLSGMLYENQFSIIQSLFEKFQDTLETCFIYIFEIFCGLDFLVKCNIIHLDIKPPNIMISQTLHLKIGDLGIAYRTRTIHKRSNLLLIKNDKLKEIDDKNYKITLEGTLDYEDFELQLLHLEKENPNSFQNVLLDPKTFNTEMINFTNEVLRPSFILDTWSAGIIAVSLLFRGFLLFHRNHLNRNIYNEIPKVPQTLLTVHLVGRKEIYSRYIQGGLIKAGGPKLKELMEFIASIFKPRLTRCQGFIKEKEVYHFSKLVKMKYVDLDKVEKIKTFAERNFCRNNIHLRKIPERIRSLFSSKRLEKRTFNQLLEEIKIARTKEACPGSLFILNPGVTISLFT